MREPLLLPLAALASGILCAGFVPFDIAGLAAGAAGLLLLAGIALWLGLRTATQLALLSLIFLFGIMRAEYDAQRPKPNIESSPYDTVLIEGCVVELPISGLGRQRFPLEIEPGARVLVSVYYDEDEAPPEVTYGQRVDITGRLREPRSFQNPGSFDYAGYLAGQGIYWTISAGSPSDVVILNEQCGSDWWRFIHETKGALSGRLDRLYTSDGRARGLLKAILLGEKHLLEDDWKDDYRASGTYHTLVISGLHLSILAGVVHTLLRLLGFSLGWKIVVTVGVAWFYTMLTGCNSPVLRAALGLTLFLGAAWFFRGRRLLNILAAVAIVFLLVDPAQLYEAGVHLSFLAVAMIGAFAVPLLERYTVPYARGLRGLHEADRDLHLTAEVASFRLELRLFAETLSLLFRIPQPVVSRIVSVVLRSGVFFLELAVVSAIIQVGLLLPMLVYFQQFPVAGFLANPIVVPLTMLLVPTGLVTLVTGWRPMAEMAGWLAQAALACANWFSDALAALSVPSPPVWLAVGYCAALILAAICLRIPFRWRWAGMIPLVVAGVMMLVHPFRPRVAAGWLEVSAIDVGQAESLFIGLPDGRTMLVDGGGIPSWKGRVSSLDTGEDVVAPYLHSRSIRSLDIIVSTHGHEDHIGGLHYLLKAFRPREVWTGIAATDPDSTALRAEARRLGIRVVELSAGARRNLGDVTVNVLAPFPAARVGREAQNDDTVVLRLTYGAHSFLLSGDMEESLERRLLPGLGRTTVLKVAHHGSKTSTSADFLAATQPAFALISAGVDNSYRLPDESVVQRMTRARVAVFRTDRNGLSSIRTDGSILVTGSMR